MEKKLLQVYLPKEMHEKLQSISKSKGYTKTALVMFILNEYLER